MAEYSKLGYGNAADLDAAIEAGKIDGKDIVVTKDTSELIYIRNDKTKQAIRPRVLCFESTGTAITELKKNQDTYAGQPVMIKDGNGKYQPFTVQTASGGSFIVEPVVVAQTGFVWQEF